MADLDRFLQDHAACERKAAAQCLALIGRAPDRPEIVEPLVALAREELLHFQQVFRLLKKRGVGLAPDEPDPYVERLRRHIRTSAEHNLLDRFLVSAMIEARSAERLALVAEALSDADLRAFYRELAHEERAHYQVFVRLARHCHTDEQVQEALARWLTIEDEACFAIEPRAAVH